MEAHDRNFNTWERPWWNCFPCPYLWFQYSGSRGKRIAKSRQTTLHVCTHMHTHHTHTYIESESVLCVMDDWAAILVLGIELQSSQRATDALNQERWWPSLHPCHVANYYTWVRSETGSLHQIQTDNINGICPLNLTVPARSFYVSFTQDRVIWKEEPQSAKCPH